MTDILNTASSDGSASTSGSNIGSVLVDVRGWLSRFINVMDELDLDILTLWAAHTYVAQETYSTPRLMLDSTMPGSGKTTVLEHLQRLSLAPVQAASLSSSAMLTRMLDKRMRTILIDEVDRSLDPKKPGVDELIAILNSGYKRGATRPVLVPGKNGDWNVAEMPTFSPVAMAGNAPHLPDDTRSRCIRVLLMPDLHGTVEPSDWEDIEPYAEALGGRLAREMDKNRDQVRQSRPALPEGCTGRMREKWGPLARVADVAGGEWPATVDQLIRRDLLELEMEREAGLSNLPPAVILLQDMHAVWEEGERFLPTAHLIERLVGHNPEYWGEESNYGKRLTAQRMGRMISQATKVQTDRRPDGDRERGYYRHLFSKPWRQTPGIRPDVLAEPSEPAARCSICSEPMTIVEPNQTTHPNCGF